MVTSDLLARQSVGDQLPRDFHPAFSVRKTVATPELLTALDSKICFCGATSIKGFWRPFQLGSQLQAEPAFRPQALMLSYIAPLNQGYASPVLR
jgi:hypothetical protein